MESTGHLWRVRTLQWPHNAPNGVSDHQPHDFLLNRLLRRKSKKTSKLRVTGLCAGNSPVTGEFPAQMASNAENVSIWWRHHDSKAVVRLNKQSGDLRQLDDHMTSPKGTLETCWQYKWTGVRWWCKYMVSIFIEASAITLTHRASHPSFPIA